MRINQVIEKTLDYTIANTVQSSDMRFWNELA